MTAPNGALVVSRVIDPKPVVDEMIGFLQGVDLALESPADHWRLKVLSAHVRNECGVLSAARPKLFTDAERALLEKLLAKAEATGSKKIVADVSLDVALLGQLFDRCAFQYAMKSCGGIGLDEDEMTLLKGALTRPDVLQAAQQCLPGIRADSVVRSRILSALGDLPGEIRSSVIAAHYPDVYAVDPVEAEEVVDACQP